MSAQVDFGRATVHVRTRVAGITALIGVRTVVVCVALVAVALLVAVLALGSGDAPIPPDRVLRAIIVGDQRFDRLVVWEWRFPRVLLALVLGAALGVSGAILQSVTRNPLGSPDIVGFGTGAYTGALIVMLVSGGGEFATAAGALVGGLAAAVAIQLLALRHNVSGFRLILVGIGVSAMLASVNAWLILRADVLSAMGAAAWGMGSLSGLTWAQVMPAIVLLTVLSLAVIPLAARLRMLELGDDLASSFGIPVRRTRLLLIFQRGADRGGHGRHRAHRVHRAGRAATGAQAGPHPVHRAASGRRDGCAAADHLGLAGAAAVRADHFAGGRGHRLHRRALSGVCAGRRGEKGLGERR